MVFGLFQKAINSPKRKQKNSIFPLAAFQGKNNVGNHTPFIGNNNPVFLWVLNTFLAFGWSAMKFLEPMVFKTEERNDGPYVMETLERCQFCPEFLMPNMRIAKFGPNYKSHFGTILTSKRKKVGKRIFKQRNKVFKMQ